MLPVVVMTAWGSVELAVEAMRRGARDFIQKPWDNARLLAIVRTQVELAGRCAGASAWRPRTGCCAPTDAPTHDRRGAVHAARAANDRARRPVGCQRADHRRARHGQGSGGAHAARDLGPREQADGHRERGRPRRRRFRKRAVRPHQGRVHRRQDGPRGPLRTGRYRHAVSRRDRQRAAEPAGEDAARARDRRDGAGGIVEDPAGRCAGDLGDERESAPKRWPTADFARTCCSG